MSERNLIATNHKEYPVLMDQQAQDRLVRLFHRYPASFRFDEFVVLDEETSRKIRELQQRTNDEIHELIGNNFHKSRAITEDDLKKIWED
jgi:hypothetical protein